MAIELGALALAIRDQGGDQVLNKLKLIDGEGRKVGSRPVRVPVSAPGAPKAAADLRLVGTNAANATKSVVGLSSAMTTMWGGVKAGLGIAGGAAVGQAIGGFLLDVSRAFDDAEAASRKLNASAKLTGASLDDIQRIAKQGETAFRLSSSASADLTANVVKLTSRAGELNKSGEFMARWLDLAAANGLTAADAMQALQTTIIGQDEGLNRLGLSNPQQIYEAWGKAAGVAAAKMTDAQKAQAIINEIVTKGTLVQGEYSRSQDTAAGKSALLTQRTEQLKVELGKLLLPLREVALGVGTTLVGAFTTLTAGIDAALTKLQAFRAFIGLMGKATPVGPLFDLIRALLGDKSGKGTAPVVTWKQNGTDAPTPPAARPTTPGTAGPAAPVFDKSAMYSTPDEMAAYRARVAQNMKGAEAAFDQKFGLDKMALEAFKLPVDDINASLKADFGSIMEGINAGLADLQAEQKAWESTLAMGLASSIMNGVASGFAMGLADGGIAEGFKQLTSQMLGGLGDVFMQVGAKAILGSSLLKSLASGLASLNPAFAIAAGVALLALARAMGGGKGSSGGYSSSFGGRSSAPQTDQRSFFVTDPRTGKLPSNAQMTSGRAAAVGAPTVVQFGLINPSDPASQRLVSETVRNANRRGA